MRPLYLNWAESFRPGPIPQLAGAAVAPGADLAPRRRGARGKQHKQDSGYGQTGGEGAKDACHWLPLAQRGGLEPSPARNGLPSHRAAERRATKVAVAIQSRLADRHRANRVSGSDAGQCRRALPDTSPSCCAMAVNTL